MECLFSCKREESIKEKFEILIERLGCKKLEVLEGLNTCTKEEQIAVKYLYSTMPISDIADYSFDIFLDYAKHAIYLWKEGEYRKVIPEDIFLNYVMHHRVNNEEIVSCREFFYNEIKDIIKGKSMKEAIIDINYWCAKEATYQATDDRTISPIGVYKSAFGRCGEESTFGVTVYRSVGIPARQVYAPRWSHCDDNHAWIEVYCDGKWHFLGACEPEEILNKGWFTSASSRAMMIHSKWFDYITPSEENVGKSGMAMVLNNLELYANTTTLNVVIIDDKGNKVSGANVDFEVLNYSEYYPIVSLLTNEHGNIDVTLGLGDIHIHAHKDGLFAEKIVNTKELKNGTIKLTLQNNIKYDLWQDFDSIAPLDAPINIEQPNKEQKEIGKSKFKYASNIRIKKAEGFYDELLVNEIIENCKNKDRIKEIFKLSRGNYNEVKEFILAEVTKVEDKYKEDILEILTIKDYRDFKSKLLSMHLKNAVRFEGKYSKEIFTKYILNPRIYIENLTDYREFISNYFTDEEKQMFIENPEEIWKYINTNIEEKEEYEYKDICTSPKGCLMVKVANNISKKILFVAICRSIGIPAKINEINGISQFYNGSDFVSVESKLQKESTLKILSKEKNINWTYFLNWSIAKLNKGVYQSLNLVDMPWDEGMTIKVESGQYRIITSNRLPNGNMFAKKLYFTIGEKEEKDISLELREAKISDMLEDIELMDFELLNDNGEKVSAREITKDNKHLLIWLEESKEPTEHILNEIYDRKLEFKKLGRKLIFIIKSRETINDPTLSRTLNVLPKARIYYDDFEENINVLGRRMYVDPDKLPLIIVVNPNLHGIYSTSGYNVGTGDMLLRILHE
ncbi:MAG: transglutaminase-like domain-containing protein [Romboutsia sp.]